MSTPWRADFRPGCAPHVVIGYKRVTVKDFLETLRAKPPVSPGD